MCKVMVYISPRGLVFAITWVDLRAVADNFKDKMSFSEVSLEFGTEALLKYYVAHPIGDRLHAHAYLETLFMLVGNRLQGYDLDLEANDYAGQLDMDEEMEHGDGGCRVLVTASRSASFRKCMGYPKQV
ncbi:hypothetical protein C8J57DRAFT_1254976 [Mycena rebaudengoi]|nr:hypothetical protein C8J57DRAFT_1254976 [Mycena rebaudengoi]